MLDEAHYSAIADTPWIAVPDLGGITQEFDIALAAPFAIAGIAAAMKAVGTITICQRMNNAEWVRPDMKSVCAV